MISVVEVAYVSFCQPLCSIQWCCGFKHEIWANAHEMCESL